MDRESGTSPHAGSRRDADGRGADARSRRRRITRRRGSALAVFAIALVLVVVVALVIGTLAEGQPEADETGARVVPLHGGAGDLRVLPAAERVEPDSEEWEALLPRLQAVVDADPADRNAQRKLALAYYNLGRLQEALAIYEDLLDAEEDPVLRNRLGNTLRDMGDVTGAEAAYRQATEEDPELAPPYINLAELLWRQGQDEEALAVIDEGLTAVPEEQRTALRDARTVLSGE